MHYSKLASLVAALASVAQATNIMTFKSLDDVDRTVHFTPNAGLRWLPSVKVPAGESVDVVIDQGWIGNCYAVQDGQPKLPGMLAEVAFNGWNGLNYYDVSAIVNPEDLDNITEMYPFDEPNAPTSGCRHGYPCNNVYYHPEDIQTKVTTQTHLVTTLGKNGVVGNVKRTVEDTSESVKRDFVLGKW